MPSSPLDTTLQLLSALLHPEQSLESIDLHPTSSDPLRSTSRSAFTEMRTAIRTGALRSLPPTSTAPIHSSVNGLRNRVPRRFSVPPSSAIHSKSHDRSEALAPAARLPGAEPVPAAVPRKRVTIADIKERRAKAGRLIAPTAAYSDADMFKAPVCTLTLGSLSSPLLSSPSIPYPFASSSQ